MKFKKSIPIINIAIFLVAITLWQCSSHNYIISESTPVDQSYTNDSKSDSIISPYKSELDKQMNSVLNTADSDLESGRPESKLGNFVSDLSMDIASTYYQPSDGEPIDFCLLNNGGLRTSVPEGPITLGLVYQLMPFENELVVITISGEKAKELFDYVAQRGGEPISNNVKVGIKENKAVNILINNKPFDGDKEYKVLTSDYLARGGDNMVFFGNPISSELVGIKLRNAIVSYLEKMSIENNTINPKMDGRVYYEK